MLLAILLVWSLHGLYVHYVHHKATIDLESWDWNRSLVKGIDTLDAANGALTREVNGLKTTNGALTKEVDTLKATNGALSEKIDTLEATNGALTGKVDVLKTMNGLLIKGVDHLKTINDALTKEVDDLKTTNGALIKEVDNLKATNGALIKELDTLKATNGTQAKFVVNRLLKESNNSTTIRFGDLNKFLYSDGGGVGVSESFRCNGLFWHLFLERSSDGYLEVYLCHDIKDFFGYTFRDWSVNATFDLTLVNEFEWYSKTWSASNLFEKNSKDHCFGLLTMVRVKELNDGFIEENALDFQVKFKSLEANLID